MEQRTPENMSFAEKQQKLLEKMKAYAGEDICLAFSGGIDSSLLLALAVQAAKETGHRVWAVTFDTVLHPPCDLETAKEVVAQMGACHQVIRMDELQNPALENNPKDRCYICKKGLFTELLQFAGEKGIQNVLEGTNEDDLHVYRPGLKAIRELGIQSPLAEAGLTKREVRTWARALGISVAERPSTPCMATRLPYGARIDLEQLGRIAACEERLRAMDFQNVRVRVHGEILRLEVDQSSFLNVLERRTEILEALREVGVRYLTLDLEGFRSGSMDD